MQAQTIYLVFIFRKFLQWLPIADCLHLVIYFFAGTVLLWLFNMHKCVQFGKTIFHLNAAASCLKIFDSEQTKNLQKICNNNTSIMPVHTYLHTRIQTYIDVHEGTYMVLLFFEKPFGLELIFHN